jgi:lysophospholipase L1-like esterase
MRKWFLPIAYALLIAGCARAPHARIPHRPARIVIVGDSVAHGAGDETGRGIAGNLPGSVSNLGINGARTIHVLRLLRTPAARSVIAASDAIVLSIGGNDLYGDSIARMMTLVWPQHAITRTLDRVAVIVSRIRAINPEARIYVLGLFDPYRSQFLDKMVASWDSRLIARFADDTNIDVVRIADLFAFTNALSSIDRFHPSAAGYALIAQRIAATF